MFAFTIDMLVIFNSRSWKNRLLSNPNNIMTVLFMLYEIATASGHHFLIYAFLVGKDYFNIFSS